MRADALAMDDAQADSMVVVVSSCCSSSYYGIKVDTYCTEFFFFDVDVFFAGS